jgi:hypothetical protein
MAPRNTPFGLFAPRELWHEGRGGGDAHGASKKLSIEDVVHESGEFAPAFHPQLGVDVLQEEPRHLLAR